jgi:hypothetical protein
MEELEVRDRWRVGLPELSALALRYLGDRPSPELLGVGDSSFSIVAGEAQAPGASAVVADLADGVSSWMSDARQGSQWEGLAADGAGCAFVLQEHPGHRKDASHVFVLAPDLRKPVGVVALVVDRGEEWRKAWNDDENARGEALVLLRGGRMLIAKQTDPVRFIEFGPTGADPAGVNPDRFLAVDESFEYPSQPLVDYVPLASWALAREDRDQLRTVNDLAVIDRRLFAISRKDHLIVQLESRAGPDEESLKIERGWRVPAAIQYPEGLAIRSGHIPIVADDLSPDEDLGGPNIFVLSRLDRS